MSFHHKFKARTVIITECVSSQSHLFALKQDCIATNIGECVNRMKRKIEKRKKTKKKKRFSFNFREKKAFSDNIFYYLFCKHYFLLAIFLFFVYV